MKICKAKYMAPLYDLSREKPEDAEACIDQFEFPDISCTYPVVWAKARQAAEICWAMGKRLCDAHEWEAACVGDLKPPDNHFDLLKGLDPEDAIRRIERHCTTRRPPQLSPGVTARRIKPVSAP